MNKFKVTFEGADSEEGEQVFTLPDQLDEFVEQIRLYATHNCDFYVNGTYNPEQTTSWSWSGLRRVNYFIDALQSEDCTVDEDIKEHYIALGYWFRAWFYFDKLCSYGDVPWFEHVISSTDEATMYKNRDPRDLIVKNLIRDLDYCYEHLKTEESVGNSLVSKYRN